MVGRSAAVLSGTEESPDRAGHPAVESAEGSNFLQSVTENNRRSYSGRLFGAAHTTVSWETSVNETTIGKGENVGQEPTTRSRRRAAGTDPGPARPNILTDEGCPPDVRG